MCKSESICRKCFHSYVCEWFNEHRDDDNQKCHFSNDHFVSSEDVVKVVRCKDCKYQDDCARQIVHTTRDYVLEQNISKYNKVDFCSYGELKEREG